jgi:dienelactone hydrolase
MLTHRKVRFNIPALLFFVLLSAFEATEGIAQPNPEAFDGSFRLQTGEVLTGGYFVEGGEGVYLYMDTEGLDKGGVFERIDDTVLGSLMMLGDKRVEVEFMPGPDGAYDTLVWREPGREPIRGDRTYPHRSRTVQFTSEDGTTLHGRLLTPECAAPYPVVVSVHGSGPVNRYGGTFHTFFLKHGIAVLAYDKRGYTDDPEAWREPDLAALSKDAAAAVRFAAAQDEIDDRRIGILGSSQGGWVAPPAAVAALETDFLILRAGAALTSGENLLHEVRQELRGEGLGGMALDHAMDLRREAYALAMAGAPIAAADALAAPYLDEAWYRTAFGEGPISEHWSEWYWGWSRRNHAVTPLPSLERFRGPVLWFLGELDENVPLVSTRAALERAFAAAPGDDHEIVVLDDAPHSFILERPDEAPRYSDGFFDYMGTWMAERGYTHTTCWQ